MWPKNSLININGFTKISGVITNINVMSSVNGSITTRYEGYVNGSIDTTHRISFRVNNTPCWYDRQPLNINEGDFVTVVGEGSGELHVYALNNRTTNVIYWEYGPHIAKVYIFTITGVFFLWMFISAVASSMNQYMMEPLYWVGALVFLILPLSCFGVAWYFMMGRKKVDEYKQMVQMA